MNYILFSVIAYLLGSIPTALWLGRARYSIDVREHGSKNAGATNTFRGSQVSCAKFIKN